ncbi:hypothetical protein Acsp03_70690 [Actinomadura sp. NBRC 104412]|uniref:hypothetical protein n=1 Tax=Actinomadura sp. NBRC 104412 TaxID=3032203 RepID=UPI0024A52BCA|nr:hypothetical protein [Actinomadura sp. NBRC 104412]GLZ09603.1 hypothetical protein Acsp03_70690 [Actinomadura sp. NBRC 104412]
MNLGRTSRGKAPDGGPVIVEPIAYRTVYCDGNAKLAVAFTEGPAGFHPGRQ